MFGERKAMAEIPEIPKIQPTYLIFKRKDAIQIQNPISYSKIISINDENKIETVMLEETDEIIEIKPGREFKINEKLLMIHRYIHNDLNMSYKDILDVEIIYTEKKLSDLSEEGVCENEGENLRISHRYPNEGRSAIDFQATILDTFIDCELRRENIINNDKKMYVMVLICYDSAERKIIGELVNRYLFIEEKEAHLSQQSRNQNSRSYNSMYTIPQQPQNPYFSNQFGNVGNNPLIQPSYNPMANIASLFNIIGNTGSSSLWSQPLNPPNPPNPSRPLNPPNPSRPLNPPNPSRPLNPPISSMVSTTMESISGTSSEISSGITSSNSNIPDEQKTDYERKIQELDRQREDELNEIRQMFFNGSHQSSNPIQNTQPALFPPPSINDFLGDGDYEITYMVSNPFTPMQYSQPSQLSLMGNMMNLLRFVNGVIGDENVIFENLMEPVRVTVSDDNMDVFLTSFKYNPDIENKDLKIKNQDNCSICLSKYEKDETVSYLNTCNHLFHTTCIDKWLREFNHKCPICRISADPSKK